MITQQELRQRRETAKVFENMTAQGELLLMRVAEVPKDAIEVTERPNGLLTVGHSESGHHHVIVGDARFFTTKDPNICYLKIEGEAYLEHLKSDKEGPPHWTQTPATPGVFEVRKQKEGTGTTGLWRQVAD